MEQPLLFATEMAAEIPPHAPILETIEVEYNPELGLYRRRFRALDGFWEVVVSMSLMRADRRLAIRRLQGYLW